MGTFRMKFDEDCNIHILSPDQDSRLFLTCSPIELADCSQQNDSLAINLVGDMSFGQNSFLYCGRDANIRANSIRNQLAIRIKKTVGITGSTFCSYHSRKYREYDPSNSASDSVECGRLGRTAKVDWLKQNGSKTGFYCYHYYNLI